MESSRVDRLKLRNRKLLPLDLALPQGMEYDNDCPPLPCNSQMHPNPGLLESPHRCDRVPAWHLRQSAKEDWCSLEFLGGFCRLLRKGESSPKGPISSFGGKW
eukprot:scaffold26154_cov137-Cylindrotheca_fusiformis.AAC.1